jgi:hypothetical protein
MANKAQTNDGAADAISVNLDEFCARLSETSKRVEVLGAFHSVETRAGRVRDTVEAYQARFNDFLNQPA